MRAAPTPKNQPTGSRRPILRMSQPSSTSPTAAVAKPPSTATRPEGPASIQSAW